MPHWDSQSCGGEGGGKMEVLRGDVGGAANRKERRRRKIGPSGNAGTKEWGHGGPAGE